MRGRRWAACAVGASLAACVALVVIQVVAAAFPSLSVRGLRAFATDAGGR